MSKTFTTEEVAQHGADADKKWVIIENGVYDVTDFADEHPGGAKILIKSCGKDASESFAKFHNSKILSKTAAPMKIGTIGEGGGKAPEVKEGKDVPKQNISEERREEAKETAEPEEDEDTTYFGDLVPFGDPFWYQDWASPYYNDSHRKVRSALRKYTDEFLTPNAHEWDEAKEIPPEAYKHVAQAGILAAIAAGGDGWPTEYAGNLPVPGKVDSSKWDAFHNFIVVDELCRCGSGGILYGLIGGFGIGLPPVIHYGNEEQKKRIIPDCLTGEKRICLAITEPEGGSDVANLVTSAVKSEDGKHYIVNGAKKWITGGIYSHYFVTAVRTGGKGMGGISLLVIERGEGVKTRKMDCSGVWASGTSYVTFEDAKVPVENLLGQENKGFQLVMGNFNPERIGIAIQANRFARVCLEESIKFASKRKTFGVLLREHPVIQAKIATMAGKIESTHAWIESIIFQSTQYDADTLTLRGGGPIALLKAHSTEVFEFCARESAQIFGGLSYTRGGQGEKVERLQREVKAYTIPGGSYEIMQSLGVRQSIKIAEIMGAKL